jgi:glycerophosphoryl diester phosphodiesterase
VLRAIRKGQLEGLYSKDLSIVLLDGENGNLMEIIADLGFVPDVYSPIYNLVYSSRIEDAHAAGVLVIPYTVNKVEDMKRLVEMGVDGIITDYPNRFFE